MSQHIKTSLLSFVFGIAIFISLQAGSSPKEKEFIDKYKTAFEAASP